MRELRLSVVACLARFKPDRFTLFLGALGFLGAVSAVLRVIPYGVALDPDGLAYIEVARNLLLGEVFVREQGGYYVQYPPLWPALLATVSFPGFDPYDVAGFVNAGAFGLAIVVSGSWLRGHIESRFLVVWACLAVVAPVFLVDIVVTTALSETVFILLIVLSLIWLERFLNRGTRSLLIWAAVWAGLACLTRFSGVTVVLTAVLILVLDRRVRPIERMKQIAMYSVVSTVPLLVWLLRGFLLTGAPAGGRVLDYGYRVTLPGSASLTLDGIGIWVFLPLNSERLMGWAATLHLDSLLVAIQDSDALATGVALLCLTGAVTYSLFRFSWEADHEITVNPILVFGAFALIYLCFLTILKSLTYIDNGARHYLTVYMPLLFISTLGLDRLLSCGREVRLPGITGRLRLPMGTVVRRWHFGLALAVVLSLWLADHAAWNVRSAQSMSTEGRGYHTTRWIESETLRYLESLKSDGRLYSQSVPLMFWHLEGKHWERSSAGLLLYSRFGNLPRETQNLSQWLEQQRASSGKVYVVWFKELGGFGDYDIQELIALPGLEVVTELSDGVILRVKK